MESILSLCIIVSWEYGVVVNIVHQRNGFVIRNDAMEERKRDAMWI